MYTKLTLFQFTMLYIPSVNFVTLFDCPCCYNVFFLEINFALLYIVEKRNAEIKQLELELEHIRCFNMIQIFYPLIIPTSYQNLKRTFTFFLFSKQHWRHILRVFLMTAVYDST